MKLKAKVLEYDKISKDHTLFTRNTKINFPEKVPFLMNSSAIDSYYFDPDAVLGIAEIAETYSGLYATIEISSTINAVMLDDLISKGLNIGIGSFYTDIKKHDTYDAIVIDEAKLNALFVTFNPAQEECVLLKEV